MGIDKNELGLMVLGAGRPARGAAPEVTIDRQLTAEDLIDLAEAQGEVPSVSSTPSLQALRDSHHRLANLLASGVRDMDASAITGYTPSRISILKCDPMFKELIAHYKAQHEAVNLQVTERIGATGLTALSLIQERLEGPEADKIGLGTLQSIFESMMDRSYAPAKGGHGGAMGGSNGISIEVNFAAPPPGHDAEETTPIDIPAIVIESK